MKMLIILLVALVAVNGAMAQWFPQNSGTTKNLNSVYFTDVNTGYAVGDSGIILKTIDGGANWTAQSSGLLKSLYSVFFTSSNTGYIVGDSGTIMNTINGGVTWELQTSGVTCAIVSVHFPLPDTGYAVGNTFLTGTILKTTNGGTNWTIINAGDITLSSVFFTDANTGYAVGKKGFFGTEGVIAKTTNGGTDWIVKVFSDYYWTGFNDICFPEANIGYVVGSCCGPGAVNGILYKSIDAGLNWTGQDWYNDSAMGAESIHFLNADTGFVTSTYGSGAIFKTTNGGVNLTGWITPAFSYPSLLYSVYFTDTDTGYVVGEGGTIMKTTNGGSVSGCLPEGITFTTQEQIDNFQTNYPGCTEIEGDVLIKGNDITSLNGLNILTSIGGYLNLGEYGGNPALNSLTGLDNLISIGGDLKMYFNNALISLAGLENLTSIGGNFGIYSNDSLTSLTGLENLVSIGGNLNIGGQDFGNASLTSLTGLDNLISIGGNLFIRDNPELSDLTALESLTFIPGDLIIIGNDSLTDCAIQNICDYLNAPNGVVEILYNGAGCNSQSEVVNACGGSVPCLPFGNYYFLSQADVDNFQINFPACNELAGDLIISGDSITNLTGLNQVYSIGGGAFITNCDNLENLNGLENLHSVGGSFGLLYENHRIKNFSGLENLDSIGGSLRIGSLDDGGPGYLPEGNDSLTSISSLVNLSHVGAGIEIGKNPSLSSLAGLENINASTLTGMVIILNSSLSTCEVQSICDYLASPNSNIDIWGNAPGCNSPEEVEAACEQHCLPDGITFTTQEQIDNFQVNYPGCTEIEGDVYIWGDVFNLEGLSVLTAIGGDLTVYWNALTSFTGLENLTSIGNNLTIAGNESLVSLFGLEGLTTISGSLEIGNAWWDGNPSLISLAGLNNLNTIGINLLIFGNDALSSLNGLEGLTSIGGSLKIGEYYGWIGCNPALTSLTGLENLNTIGASLSIAYSDALTTLEGLDNLDSIGASLSILDNSALTSLEGLDGLTFIGAGLNICNNNLLSECDAQGICMYLSDPAGVVEIRHNAPGCSGPGQIANACGITMPCLPYGNYYFFSQADVDNFQADYPGCYDLQGNVSITGDDIVNLSGFSGVSSISGDLNIGRYYNDTPYGNPVLTSLTGFENLTQIGGTLLIIRNDTLTSLSGLDNLSYIGNDLLIGVSYVFSPKNMEALTSINALGSLTSIGGEMYISSTSISSLTGLDNVSTIGGNITIRINDYLSDISSLNKLTSIAGGLQIDHTALSSLEGLNNVTTIDRSLRMYKNHSLKNFEGLNNLSYIGTGAWISENDSLTSFEGLNNLEYIDEYLTITDNPALAGLSGLENLDSIGSFSLYIRNNDQLTSLSGLDHVFADSITELKIFNNALLQTCDVQSICDYLASPHGIVEIYNNAPGCNSPEEVEAACEQHCLPEGITFTTQEQIDNFQINYPECTEIVGNLIIGDWMCGSTITNLNGLSVLTSVGGWLGIVNNPFLTNLTGLESLTTIVGGLNIEENDLLTNLNGLSSLISVDYLIITRNDLLSSISGMNNIVANSLSYLAIYGNSSLSSCETACICNYLANPGGSINIFANAPGCNSPSEAASACGIALPCLPYGNYIFINQSDIDQFYENFPNCNTLNGKVTIGWDEEWGFYVNSDISNLNGLLGIESVGAELMISTWSDNLITLDGLDSLKTIGRGLYIADNYSLNDISALESVISVDGRLFVISSALTSLSALKHINANSITQLLISGNSSLSECHVQSICDYLANPSAWVMIYNNAPGCNSPGEVIQACLEPVEEINSENSIRIMPNPARDMITVSLPMLTGNEQLTLFNITGEKLLERQITNSETHINISALPRGVYVVRVQNEKMVETEKIIKQ